MKQMKPLSSGQEYVIRRIKTFFGRHHRLITHFILYNEATNNRTLYYVYEDVCLLMVTDERLAELKVEVYKNTEYRYLVTDPTIIFNSSDSKIRYISTSFILNQHQNPTKS